MKNTEGSNTITTNKYDIIEVTKRQMKHNENNIIRHELHIYSKSYTFVFRWRSNYQEGRFGIPLTGLTPLHLCVCPKQWPGFPMSYVVVFFVISEFNFIPPNVGCRWYTAPVLGGAWPNCSLYNLQCVVVCSWTADIR
jgi:hypothetical protein